MQDNSACSEPGCCDGLDRRQFVKLGAASVAALGLSSTLSVAGPFGPEDTRDHFIPIDKKLRPDWLKLLYARGARMWYAGDDLKTIGMPIGGICAGQVYLTGDGRLVYWSIYNQNINTGFGAVNYKVGRLPTEMVVGGNEFKQAPVVDQGVAIRIRSGAKTETRSLDRKGCPNVRFSGEYPIAYVDYALSDLPVQVTLEAFSPFIPLNEPDSALPATVLNYTVKNTSKKEVEFTLAGWLENAVLHYSADRHVEHAVRTSRVVRNSNSTSIDLGINKTDKPAAATRPPIILADFEGSDYGDWKVEGDAFGTGPARGTLKGQQTVSGFAGKGLVNTFLNGDQTKGKLTSPKFTLDRHYLSFLIGGGNHAGTSIQLLVAGKVVEKASGKSRERLEVVNWNVRQYEGQAGQIEIIDQETGAWGHINIDQISLRDTPRSGPIRELDQEPDFGTMALTVVGTDGLLAAASLPDGPLPEALLDDDFFDGAGRAGDVRTEKALDQSLRGAVGVTRRLAPGQQTTVTLVVSWHMPNMYFRGQDRVGNFYATRFGSAMEVGRYVADNLNRLGRETRLWHDSYYDSTLPYWLLDRLHSTVGNLATTTCQWWENGRFWAWEGCGCCSGTCGHVWNYEHAMARLFPRLERSVREMQDFAAGVGFIADTGEIRFRGENWGIWAGDSQGGYILKAYREHLTSRSNDFLKRNWKNIRKAVEFLIQQDGDGDGLIEGIQHQTYDKNYYGANTMVGSLYLGALRAAEEMAKLMGETAFARQCRTIFEAGSKNSVEILFNGEYYIQRVDLKAHPDWQYANGCLADQMFGQGWAHQVALGYLYPKDTVLKSLESIWKYDWAPDVGQQNEAHPPQRWFAYPGEAGLFTCTWPKSQHMGPKSTLYRDEIWTGIEYQVANNMAYEGMLTEALAICRGVHDRYHPSKHNPFNEIECGDHYARPLASWGVLLGLAGYQYDGPRRHLAFAPRLTPEKFRIIFTTADGWGIYNQQRRGNRQQSTLDVKWGSVAVATLAFDVQDGHRVRGVTVNGTPLAGEWTQDGPRVVLTFAQPQVVKAGAAMDVELTS